MTEPNTEASSPWMPAPGPHENVWGLKPSQPQLGTLQKYEVSECGMYVRFWTQYVLDSPQNPVKGKLETRTLKQTPLYAQCPQG